MRAIRPSGDILRTFPGNGGVVGLEIRLGFLGGTRFGFSGHAWQFDMSGVAGKGR